MRPFPAPVSHHYSAPSHAACNHTVGVYLSTTLQDSKYSKGSYAQTASTCPTDLPTVYFQNMQNLIIMLLYIVVMDWKFIPPQSPYVA